MAMDNIGSVNGSNSFIMQVGSTLPSLTQLNKCTTALLTWDALYAQLKWGLLVHVYGFASLFFVLAFYAFFSILNLRSLISSRPFMATINGFVCLLGATRAASLFIDPYSVSHAMPKAIGTLMWDVGFPCVTSAFCLIQLAFLQLTQLNLGPEKLRRKSCLSVVITAHFSCVIGADIAVAFYEHFLLGKYIMQGLFVIWGMVLCTTFLYGGHRVRQLVQSVPSGLLACGPLNTQHKGIMQLAMLAPYNNLASSVAAALVPTLLAPKIHITDENEQTFSYTSGEANDLPSTSAAPKASTSRANTCEEVSVDQTSRRSRHGASQRKQTRQRLQSDEDDAVIQPSSSLLSAPQSSSSSTVHDTAAVKPDYTLLSVLNHIALVSRNGDDTCESGRKSQVQQVLSVTTATAVLGLILCIAELLRVVGNSFSSDITLIAEPLSPVWPWFIFQSISRSLELAMGCAMAAVTKQPVVRPPQPFAPYSLRPSTLYI